MQLQLPDTVKRIKPETMEMLDALAYLKAAGYGVNECAKELATVGLWDIEDNPKDLDKVANQHWDYFYSRFQSHYEKVIVMQMARSQGVIMDTVENNFDPDTRMRAASIVLGHAREWRKLNGDISGSSVQIENPRLTYNDKADRIKLLLAKASPKVKPIRKAKSA